MIQTILSLQLTPELTTVRTLFSENDTEYPLASLFIRDRKVGNQYKSIFCQPAQLLTHEDIYLNTKGIWMLNMVNLRFLLMLGNLEEEDTFRKARLMAQRELHIEELQAALRAGRIVAEYYLTNEGILGMPEPQVITRTTKIEDLTFK